MKRMYLAVVFLAILLSSLMVDTLYATVVYPLEVFTNNGGYHDSPDLDLYVEVVDSESRVDFIFHNESIIDSSIARIYLEGGSFLSFAEMIEGPGTSFNPSATPAKLPGADLLDLSLQTTYEVSFDSEPAAPHNGINPDEWLMTTFDLINSGTFQNMVDELNTGVMWIGVHVIALPDGSSESAIAVPEPAALFLLWFGALTLLRKRRS
ncbi:MAG: PEP-CTERM sorting domain-containing protein [Planctomycetota bacterium]